MRRLAYIPARSGSKGVPDKNIRALCGKPLMAWMIDAALKSCMFDRVMVSTDSQKYAEIATSCGAWVPFLRDPAVARDTTPSIVSICSDKVRLEKIGERFDSLCLLQPTTPLCRHDDIVNAINLFERIGAGVVSVVRSSENPNIMRYIDSNGRLTPVVAPSGILRRQDSPVVYRLNGAIYINAWEELAENLMQGWNPYGYVMDEVSSIDIDTLEDFEIAERYMRLRLAV